MQKNTTQKVCFNIIQQNTPIRMIAMYLGHGNYRYRFISAIDLKKPIGVNGLLQHIRMHTYIYCEKERIVIVVYIYQET